MDYNFEAPVYWGLALHQAIWQLHFAGPVLPQTIGGITTCRGDSGSSYILNTRNQFSIAVHHAS